MPRKTTPTTAPITTTAAVGSRPSLPGQAVNREEWLRTELNEELQPQGMIEKRWVEDIAHRWARIDLIRAQYSGLQNRLVRDQLDNFDERKDRITGDMFPFPLTPRQREVFEACQAMGKGIDIEDVLDNPEFAWLLGHISSSDLQLLTSLQGLEHDEARERDRVINQFERRRRMKAQHLILLIDAKTRGALPTVCDSPELETVVIESEENAVDVPVDGEA